MEQVLFDYTRPDARGASTVAHVWAKVPLAPPPEQRREQKARAAELLKQHDAVLVAHYYVDGDLQDLALETGGCVADSLEMARFGRDHPSRTLVVAGVRFMGESAKILSPTKRVLMPDLEATCSLDLGLPAGGLRALLRRAPRPQGRRLRQHERRGEGARRLDGDELVRAGDRQPPEAAGRKGALRRPTGTWAATSRSKPAPTCCCGTAHASCTTSSRASSSSC